MNIHTPTPAQAARTPRQDQVIKDTLEQLAQLPLAANPAQDFDAIWQNIATLPSGLVTRDEALRVPRLFHTTFYDRRKARFPAGMGPAFMHKMVVSMRNWERSIKPHFAALSASDWTGIFQAYDILNIAPGPAIIHGWSNHWRNAFAATAPRVGELATLLAAFGNLRLQPEAALIAQTRTILQNAAAVRLAPHYDTLMRAFACLDTQQNNPQYRSMAHDCLLRGSFADPQPNFTAYAQIRDASLWFDFPLPPARRRAQPDIQSSSENNIRRKFAAGMTVLPRDYTYLDVLDKSTDIAVQCNAGIVHVEIDGPFHFLYSKAGQRYKGSTLYQSALMQKATPGVAFVRISTSDFDRIAAQYPREFAHILRRQFNLAASRTTQGSANSAVLTMAGPVNSVFLRPLAHV